MSNGIAPASHQLSLCCKYSVIWLLLRFISSIYFIVLLSILHAIGRFCAMMQYEN